MGIAAIGTRTTDSFGVTKSNRVGVSDETKQLDALEYNRIADAVIELQEAVGTSDEPETGSVEARIVGHDEDIGLLEGRATALEAATFALATLVDDLTEGSDRQVVTCEGLSEIGDGGGGDFVWRAASVATDDGGGTVKAVSGVATGRWHRLFTGDVWLRWFGATADGVTDDYQALFAAYNAADALGVDVQLGAGSYAISTTLTMIPLVHVSNFGKVPKIKGAGVGCTTLYNGVASGAMFELDSAASHATFKGLLGAGFSDFTMLKVGSPAACTGIKARTCYHMVIERVHISGMSANGIQFTTAVGDLDSSIMPVIRDVRIENCAGWGIKADADSGFNEMSFLRMENVFVQACGTVSASTPPPSGGMIYKGQILSMQNCCFAGVNQNVGLFVKGDAGLGSNVNLQDVTFENCVKRSIYCTGVNGFKAKNVQFYNNASGIATTGVEFDGSTYYVGNVEFDGVTVRATSGNSALTAFKISGANAELDTCRVRNVDWQLYDYTGQIRFDGWKFDTVPMQCALVLVNDQIVRLTPAAPGTGNAMPLRATRALAGNDAPSTSGEWYQTNIATNGEAIAPTTGSGPEVPITLIEGGSIAASTRYHCYLWNDTGVRKISLSATAPEIDAVSGYWTRAGDNAKLWVGAITTTAAASPNIRFSHVETHSNGYTGSAVYDPGSLADGVGVTTTVTVTGAALGDYAQATFSLDLQGITLTAWVSAANTVSVRFQNETGNDGLTGSATFDPSNLADGAGETTTVTVTGAALGDYVTASFSQALQGITMTAWVSASNTVSVRFQNETGGAVDLASGTLTARVRNEATGAINLASGVLRARVERA